MPVTEHLWTWDRFFETGRDFELGTLMVLTFFCLVLVLSKQRKRCLESLLSMCRIPAFQFSGGVAALISLGAEALVFDSQSVAGPGMGLRYFPLQI